jgi:hypothetical protein
MSLHLARRDRVARWFFAGMGLLLVWQGLYTVRRGLPAYPNYWGGVVSPWFGIGVGLFVAAFCLFLPRRFARKPSPGESKPYGAPWENYKKW